MFGRQPVDEWRRAAPGSGYINATALESFDDGSESRPLRKQLSITQLSAFTMLLATYPTAEWSQTAKILAKYDDSANETPT
jgi:hypothetical protein